MTRSFSYLCITITNTICLTGLWILIALFPDLFVGIESLTTILKSSILLGFIMDSVVCFSEFALLVWLKVLVPPLYYFLLVICSSLKLLIYLTVTAITIYLDHSISVTWHMAYYIQWVSFLHCRIFNGICTIEMINWLEMIYMNEQLSNVVHGINNPVAYPVGPIGRQAMAGA